MSYNNFIDEFILPQHPDGIEAACEIGRTELLKDKELSFGELFKMGAFDLPVKEIYSAAGRTLTHPKRYKDETFALGSGVCHLDDRDETDMEYQY